MDVPARRDCPSETTSDDFDRRRAASAALTRHAANRDAILSYYQYAGSVIREYKDATSELTTPLNERRNLNRTESIKFSDLQDLLGPSLMLKYSFEKSVIERYYEAESAAVAELKYILANFELGEFSEVRNRVVDLLTLVHISDVSGALIGYAKRPPQDQVRKMLSEMIKKFEGLPPKEYHSSNLLTPVIILYQAVTPKITLIDELEKQLANLQDEKSRAGA